MGKSTAFSRQNTELNPYESMGIALPIYLRSTGINIFEKGHNVKRMDIINPFVEIVWSIRGVGAINLYNQIFQLHENDVFFYFPNEMHERYALSNKWEHRWLCFDGPLAVAILHAYNYMRVQHAESYPAKLFEEMEAISSENDPVLIRRGAALILEVLAYAADNRHHEILPGKIAKQALEIIRENISNAELSVAMVSEMLGVSQNHLTSIFRECTAKTPGRYILDCRLERAQSLLRGTDIPIKEVAFQCGFDEPRTFNRFIRRAMNCTPLDVRKGILSSPKSKKKSAAFK